MSSLLKAFPNPNLHPSQFTWNIIFFCAKMKYNTNIIYHWKRESEHIFNKISANYNGQGLHTNVYIWAVLLKCPILLDVLVCSKHGWNKRHRKDQNCCINQCGRESNYPKLMLYYTNTRKYCGKEANLQVTVVLCLPNGALFPRTWLSLSKSRAWW